MALIQCKECNNMVSNQAEKCPHCGALIKLTNTKIEKQTKRVKISNKFTFWIPLLFIFTLFIIFPLFVKKWIGQPEIGRADITKEVDKSLLELQMRSWLNERAQEECLGDIKCLSVSLIKESANKYVGFAEFDNGCQLDVSAVTDDEEVLLKSESFSSLKYEEANKAMERLHNTLEIIPEEVDKWRALGFRIKSEPLNKKQILKLQRDVAKLLADKFLLINNFLIDYPEYNYVLEDWMARNPDYFIAAGSIVSDYNEKKNRAKDAETYLICGIDYKAKGELDQAILYFTKAIETNPTDPNAYYLRGDAYCIQKKFYEAMSDCDKAIDINPLFAEAYYVRGNVFCMKKEFDQSIIEFNKAIEINPRFAKAYRSRGIVYDTKGLNEKAISDYSIAIDLNPWDAGAYMVRGICYKTIGNFDQAIIDYTKSIEINPKNAIVYCHRGIVYTSKGEYEKAIMDYMKAINIDSDFAQAYCNLGYVYYKKGKYDKAWENVQKAQSLGLSDSPTFIKDLREILEIDG